MLACKLSFDRQAMYLIVAALYLQTITVLIQSTEMTVVVHLINNVERSGLKGGHAEWHMPSHCFHIY